MSSPIQPPSYDQSTQPQQSFASNYDLDNPLQAMSSYSKLIHQHTKRQMEASTTTSRRTDNSASVSSISSLSSEGSVDSVDSLQE